MGYRNNLYDAGEWDLKSSSALTYDAEKVADFIEDLRYVNERYNDKLGMLGTEYDHYRDNQTFVGRAATASKYAIEIKQKGYLHEGVYSIEKAIYDKYCSLDDMFKEMVDPSPKARIDTDVIENVKCDYVRQAETSDIVGRVLENSSRYLEQEFGDLGQVTQINYNGVRAIYDEFNGNGGMLDKCVKRMEDYETEALASVDNSQLDYQVSDLQGAITRAAGGLNDMKTYDPSMEKNSISLVALGASVGVAGAATALGAKQENKDITLEKCSANSLSAASASIPLGQRYAQKNLLEKIKKAKKNYEDQVKYNKDQKAGKTLAELQSLNTPHANLPDYTEEIDKWVAEQEKYFDPMYKNSHHTGGGKGQFMLKFIDKVKTTGDMDIKQQDKWEKAFHMPYPPATGQPYFLYHGQVMDPATLGNVVGAKYYPDEMLRFGGGAVQTKRRDSSDLPFIFTIPDYGEMPEDVQAINLGLRWRKEGFPDER